MKMCCGRFEGNQRSTETCQMTERRRSSLDGAPPCIERLRAQWSAGSLVVHLLRKKVEKGLLIVVLRCGSNRAAGLDCAGRSRRGASATQGSVRFRFAFKTSASVDDASAGPPALAGIRARVAIRGAASENPSQWSSSA